ncbi:MAG TPA: DUF1553 domain-containing protein [Planctomycetes bacterium]|nr:DUF1553 domain-containing protein [Planctomycetaceae bacterium]HIM28589.1 DUF1553 domain-containing protein [Planctomycetota bacterium]
MVRYYLVLPLCEPWVLTMSRILSLLASLSVALAAVASSAAEPPDAGVKIDFNRDIRPLLSDKCFACHGPDEQARKAELRLDSEREVFDVSQVIVRGKPTESELIARVFSDDPDEQMPPPKSNKSLTAEQKQLLQRWVEQGAQWNVHWAYVAPVRGAVPDGDQPIDHFISNRFKSDGLTFSPPADRITLIRRLYFDLLGLPPTPAEVDAFVNDKSADAYEKLVDRLLKSPHYGERLAVYWLDVVRFADSNGYHSDEARKISPYRDYVINAFNDNMAYDQFVTELLAGDLLPDGGLEQQIASGFNMLLQTTSEGGAQAKEYIAKYAADRVRNTSQIFLGSTMGCAECHNHKFDPFTQRDFYSFAAFFADIQQPAVGNPATFSVMLGADKEKIAEMDRQAAAIQEKLDADSPELVVGQTKWEDEIAATIEQTPQYGSWFVAGPFRGASLDAVFARDWIDPKNVDLESVVDGKAWSKLDGLLDGKVFAFPADANSARYVTRTVESSVATKLKLSLGSDDTLTVWVNGEKVHDNKVSRGVAADQDKIVVPLVAGENRLLFRICNGGGGHGFYFRGDGHGLPVRIQQILKLARGERNTSQQVELKKYYRTVAPELQPFRVELSQAIANKKMFVDSRPRTMMTKTGKMRVIRLLNRGDWMDDSGPVVEPAIPSFLGTLDVGGRRPNRLDLAHWIVDRENPLTARTFVNRLWKLYLGHGLATPLDDLGRQGTLPTHPELLDWIAIEFMESGWDIRHIVRLMVTSRTYQQSSMVTTNLKQHDPYNLLFARQSRFRIEAEFVRDNALAISGLLVRDIGGRSVYPYQPAGYWRHMNFPARKWPGDSGASLYRRGLYTWWQRMFLHPSLLAFDAPSREECTVERPRSNIPQQALVLLNDPTYVEAARAFAMRIIEEGGTAADDRIRWAWREALSRRVADREVSVVRSVFDKHLSQYQDDLEAAKLLTSGSQPQPSDDAATVELASWISVARVILNLHETITRY